MQGKLSLSISPQMIEPSASSASDGSLSTTLGSGNPGGGTAFAKEAALKQAGSKKPKLSTTSGSTKTESNLPSTMSHQSAASSLPAAKATRSSTAWRARGVEVGQRAPSSSSLVFPTALSDEVVPSIAASSPTKLPGSLAQVW